MSQAPSSSSAEVSPFACIQYDQARRDLQKHHGAVVGVFDKPAARAWALKFGQLLVRLVLRIYSSSRGVDAFQTALSSFAVSSGNVVQDDVVVRGMIDSARDLLVSYITSDWLQLAPELVASVAGTLATLNPGESLGEAYPTILASASRYAAAAATASTASPGLGLSLTVPLPRSRSPSSGSGDVDSPQLESDAGLSSRVLRPIPRPSYRRLPVSSSAAAGSVLPAVVAPAAVISPAASIAPIPSSSAPRKRFKAAGSRSPCVSCKTKKKGCSLMQGGPSPCAACVASGVKCVSSGAFCTFLSA